MSNYPSLTVPPDQTDLDKLLRDAAEFGDLEQCRLAIARGANVGWRDVIQWTPLHWAARNGHTQIAQLLLQSNADVNARDADLKTPMHRAAFYGHLNMVQLLIRLGGEDFKA